MADVGDKATRNKKKIRKVYQKVGAGTSEVSERGAMAQLKRRDFLSATFELPHNFWKEK